MEISNILSLISHHSIFRFGADQVDNFMHMNVQLYTSKLSKFGFKWKVCILSTKFKCS
jgi:hypothetical protein